VSPSLSFDAQRARTAVAAFDRVSVLVVGDVMLDQFIVGRVDRISPEAPVPVVEHDHDEYRIGGAGNVANNAKALGASVQLVGLVGADRSHERLRDEFLARGIGCDGLVVDSGRPTTTKQRIVTTRNQQVARVDYESDAEAAGAVEDALVAAVERHLAEATVVIVSDYLKGAVTRRVVARIVAGAGGRAVPVLVDPKIPHIDYYAGSTIVTPNHHEAEIATHLRIRTDDDARRAGHVFLERAGCRSVLITRGEHGMSLVGADGNAHFPAVAREVADVTGAGDTVIATLALALAAGADAATAAQLANYAAGIVVGHFGPATVSPAELLAQLG
jgi:D-beta-D-heptose 7-phosphate kinase/D-beta-D-heptose 1-phosphate adenosyltransferase